jgi:ATP-dependent helicase/nuclease subunit B
MCPFRFFVSTGLHAEERLVFELDKREEGSFQHEILAEFHRRVEKLNKQWRDITFDEAREIVTQISADLKSQFQEGLADANPSNRFRAEVKTSGVLEFLKIYLQLLKDCEFSPRHVELNFGDDGPLPIWVVQVDSERTLQFSGRVDRVDMWLDEANQRCYVAIFDYTSSKKELDRKLVEHAIQQQLPAYLAALQKNGNSLFPFPLRAGGAFYVNLRLKISPAKSRAEVEETLELKQTGVFDWDLKSKFDPKETGALFDYTKKPTAGGALRAVHSDEFTQLLTQTEERLRLLGKRIFDGDLRLDPYRHKNQTPCERCFYIGICRVDSWTHEFRELT